MSPKEPFLERGWSKAKDKKMYPSAQIKNYYVQLVQLYIPKGHFAAGYFKKAVELRFSLPLLVLWQVI
jgi:hypothetical protein